MKRMLLLLLCLLLPLSALAEALPARDCGLAGEEVLRYDADTLKYDIRRFDQDGTMCYLTQVWLQDPGRQIRKATAVWEKDLRYPSDMAKTIDGAALCVNGSGYVSPVFPGIPDDYPGSSKDYFYTPLGSLTVTDGALFRDLHGVAYYGLTLEEDGLHLYNGADNEAVLAASPSQTWSFYTRCPMIVDGVSVLDTEWSFAKAKAIRTVICKLDQNNYALLTVTGKTSTGMSLIDVVSFLQSELSPVWAYDLDGGPSSALLARLPEETTLTTIYGNNSKDADVMVFVE